MLSKLKSFVASHKVEVGVGAVAVAAIGYAAYKVLNPPPPFKDVVHFQEDEFPEQLRQIALAIHQAGAEEVFFQVEAQELHKNFMQFAVRSPTTGELVLTHEGFCSLLRTMGVQDAALLEQIFHEWDKNGNGELNFCEMLQAITLCLKGSSKSKLVAMFHIMDTDGDGCLTRKVMTSFFVNMYAMTNRHKSVGAIKAQVDELFERADKDFSGTLTLEEFLEMGSSAKFVVGETLEDHLEALTKRFAQTLGGTPKTGQTVPPGAPSSARS